MEAPIRHLRWRWHRHVRTPINRWLDRRFRARHLREYGWPLSLGMVPFSLPENRWHECQAHEWERIDWPYGRAIRRGHRPDRVTRCRNCGAPRCDSYLHFPGTPDRGDNDWQGIRCVWERHHTEAHEYLSGERIEVGA